MGIQLFKKSYPVQECIFYVNIVGNDIQILFNATYWKMLKKKKLGC